MLILNRKVGESVVIRDWMDYLVTLDHYVVEPGKPTKVMLSISKGGAVQRYILPLGESVKLAEDISVKCDNLQITATRDGLYGSLKMLLDLPPRDSARSVDVIRSELLDKYSVDE